MAAGLATLEKIEEPNFFSALSDKTSSLIAGLKSIAVDAGVPLAVESQGGMFGFVFSEDDSVSSYEQVAAADIERFKKFFHGMLERGIYLAPSAFEVGFISSAHGDEEIAKTLDAARQTMATLA